MRPSVARLALAIMLPASLVCAAPAQAHFVLLYPPSRGVKLESAPCGAAGSTRGATPTVLRPGQTIVVQWNVQVDHLEPPRFRIAFDDSGQDFPTPTGGAETPALPFVLDGILAPGGGLQTKQIALPNVECDNCTLQMLQYLAPQPPYAPGNFYYQCADITLSAEAPDPADAGARDGAVEAAASDPASDASDAQDAPPAGGTSDAGALPRLDASGPPGATGVVGCGYAGDPRAGRFAPALVTVLLTAARARRARRGRSSR